MLAKHRRAVALIFLLLVDAAATNAAAILYAPMSVHAGGTGDGLSLLMAANALGGVLAAVVATRLARSTAFALAAYSALLVLCLPIFLAWFAPNFPSLVALMFVSGCGMVVVDVLTFTSLQRDLPQGSLGRALGTVDGVMLLTIVGATVAATALHEAFGLGASLALLGVGMPVLGLLGVPALRAADREHEDRIAALADRIALLEGLPLFAGASRAALELLAEAAQPEVLAPGTELIRQGDSADALWVLTSGTLSPSYTHDDVSSPLPDVVAPGWVGELGVLSRAPRSATVVAKDECHVLRIGADDFRAAIAGNRLAPAVTLLAGERLSRTGSAPGLATDVVTS